MNEKMKTSLTKKESVEKLEKVLNLWKTKNLITQIKKEQENPNNNNKNKNNNNNNILDETVMFLGRKISKKGIEPNSLEDITLKSQRLCEEYIEGRLARSGIKGFDNNNSTQETEEYSNVLKNMGQILEMKYPKLYSKISTHLNLTYDSEIVVWDSFNKFGTHLFSEGLTWAKIIAFYAFCGGLALDCMSHGKNNLPGRIVYWFGVFAQKKMSPWIKEQGGWDSIVSHFNRDLPEQYNDDSDGDDDDEDENKYRFNLKKRLKRLAMDTDNKIRILLLSVLFVVTAYVVVLYIRR